MEAAASECCKFGLRLASFETIAEYNCAILNTAGKYYFYLHQTIHCLLIEAEISKNNNMINK
jgi:hypothetical protein